MRRKSTERTTTEQEAGSREKRSGASRPTHNGAPEPAEESAPRKSSRSRQAKKGTSSIHNGEVASPPSAPPGTQAPELVIVAAAEYRTARTSWLWENHLEWGSVAIMQGAKGAGKSTWMRALAADVTGGPRVPGSAERPRVAGSVLWFAGEESLATIVQPGLAVAGADLSRCYLADTLGEEEHTLRLPLDAERLRTTILARKVCLIVIDPLFSFLDGSIDIEAGSVQARQFVRPLMALASQTGVLLLLSRNLTKDTSRGALAAGRGSGELGNAARSVLHLHGMPQTPGVYGLAVAACNSGRQSPTLTYTIDDCHGSGVIRVTGACQLTADELAAGDDGDLDRGLLESAMALIRAVLPAGELPSTAFRSRAEAAMIGTRTLQLAAQRLGIRYRREGRRENTVVYWICPEGGYGK